MSTLVFDTRAVFQREMSLVLRDPFSVIFLVQPLVFLGSLEPAAGGLGGSGCAQRCFAAAMVPSGCDRDDLPVRDQHDRREPAVRDHDRFVMSRVLASLLRRSALLIGKALKEPAPLVVQAALVTLVAVPFGFKLYPLHVLAGLLLLGVFGVDWAPSTHWPLHAVRGNGCSGRCNSRCCSRY